MLQREGVPCEGLFYEPVYKSALFPLEPGIWPALARGRETPLDLKTSFHCPVCERAAYEEAVWLPHHIFLGSKKDTDDIADAVLRTCANIEEPRGLEHPAIEVKAMSRAERPEWESGSGNGRSSMTRNPSFMVDLFRALVFLLLFHQAQASQHVADRHVRVI